MNDRILIYEFDCFNCIISNDEQLLRKIFPTIFVPQYSFYEFHKKCIGDKRELLNYYLKNKFIKLEDFDYEDQAYQTFMNLKNGKNCQCRSKNESTAIALAKHSKFTLLTSKTESLKDFNISTLTLVDLLLNTYKNNKITLEEAENIWKKIDYVNHVMDFESFEKYLNFREDNS